MELKKAMLNYFNGEQWEKILFDYKDLLNQPIEAKTTAQWAAVESTLVAQKDVVYIYTDKFSYTELVKRQGSDEANEVTRIIPGLKIGNGTDFLGNIPFITDAFTAHINNSDIHVTSENKTKWSNKLNCVYHDDGDDQVGLLEFTRD